MMSKVNQFEQLRTLTTEQSDLAQAFLSVYYRVRRRLALKNAALVFLHMAPFGVIMAWQIYRMMKTSDNLLMPIIGILVTYLIAAVVSVYVVQRSATFRRLDQLIDQNFDDEPELIELSKQLRSKCQEIEVCIQEWEQLQKQEESV